MILWIIKMNNTVIYLLLNGLVFLCIGISIVAILRLLDKILIFQRHIMQEINKIWNEIENKKGID